MIKVLIKDSSVMDELEDESVQLAISSFSAGLLSMIVPPALENPSVNDARIEIKKMSKRYNLSLAQYLLLCAYEGVVAQYEKSIVEIERCLKPDGLFFLEIGHTSLEAEKNLFVDDFKTLYPFTIAWDIIERTNLKLRKCFTAKNTFKIVQLPPHHERLEAIKNDPVADSVEYWLMFSKTEKWKDNTQIKLPLILNGTIEILQFILATLTGNKNTVKLRITQLKRSPKNILSLLIRKFSDEGDLILDGFAGSGTIGEVAEPLKRNSILYERDARKIAVMAKCFEKANCFSPELFLQKN